MKKIIIASILIIGLATGLAYAHGNRWGGGWGGHMMSPGYGGHMMGYNGGNGMMGPGMMGYNGEYGMRGPGMMGGYDGAYGCPGAGRFGQDGWDSGEHQKFLKDTVGLRKELNDKRFDYMEAQRNPETSRDQLAALEKQITDIENQLQEKAQQY